MRVFVTGATGFIGDAVVRELQSAGHSVVGLARSDASAKALRRAGAEVRRGELTDATGLADAARAADGVIHLAFIHDFSQYMAAAATDRTAVDAMLGVLEGTGKPFVGTSGTMLVSPGRTLTEDDAADAGIPGRGGTETVIVEAAGRGIRTSSVRLSPTVHGAGDHAFVPAMIGIARRTGVAAYVGDGANRWPAVHRSDAARLFRLALEDAKPGTRLHGVAEEGIPMRTIAEAIGQGLGVPVRSVTTEEAQAHFDWLARFVAIDNPASSGLTRRWLGWDPQGPELLTDMRENGYFS